MKKANLTKLAVLWLLVASLIMPLIGMAESPRITVDPVITFDPVDEDKQFVTFVLKNYEDRSFLCTFIKATAMVKNHQGKGEVITRRSIVAENVVLPAGSSKKQVEVDKEFIKELEKQFDLPRIVDVTVPTHDCESIRKLSPSKVKKLIEKIAREVILAIKNKDGAKLSSFAHPILGIRFSPFAYVGKDDTVFTASQLKDVFLDSRKYLWGSYDGSGDPITLTFAEYYQQFIYNKDFINVEKVTYNETIPTGCTINNSFEFYPNGIVVEFHFPESEEYGTDWGRLRLVFEGKDNIWYLVGIINDEWTI